MYIQCVHAYTELGKKYRPISAVYMYMYMEHLCSPYSVLLFSLRHMYGVACLLQDVEVGFLSILLASVLYM